MKRAALGGAPRGPVGAARQRRTIRLVQVLLVLISGALLVFAGYSLGRVDGYRTARASTSFDRPRAPSVAQPVVLVILGAVAIGAAAALQKGGSVRMPTPARIDEFVGRAEQLAIEKAEREAER